MPTISLPIPVRAMAGDRRWPATNPTITDLATVPDPTIADELVGGRRGILAADERIGSMSARLQRAGLEPTAENRRAYREMLVTTPNLSRGVSGVILCDETFRQRLADGRTFPEALTGLGMLPGIKVDAGTHPLAGAPGETVTQGLDGLDERLAEYSVLGARFAKWRAVLTVGEGTPSCWALQANAHALARYARACCDAGMVPIVQPEVLMTGDHDLQRCADITTATLFVLFRALADADVDPSRIVLNPNMVLPGHRSDDPCPPDRVARKTVEILRLVVPETLAGVAFLSGGQTPQAATANLAAVQRVGGPWPMTFSFGRALVAPALRAWRGEPGRVALGQRALGDQVHANTVALRGRRARLRIA